MCSKTFVCLCIFTINRIDAFFNAVHVISDMNNLYKFEDIWKIITRVKRSQIDKPMA